MSNIHCDARVSPVDKYHQVLRLIANSDVEAFYGVDGMREFLKAFGTEKTAYMDAVTFLSLAEMDGRLNIRRRAGQEHYSSSFIQGDVYIIDASERSELATAEESKVLEPGTFVLAEGVPAVIVATSVETIVRYEVKDQDGAHWACVGDRVQDLDQIKRQIES